MPTNNIEYPVKENCVCHSITNEFLQLITVGTSNIKWGPDNGFGVHFLVFPLSIFIAEFLKFSHILDFCFELQRSIQQCCI
jgi:hypothetical protein